jgi:hypothetical protein
MFFLPVSKLVRIGNIYEMLLMVTAVPRRELNAVEEPRYRHPRAAITAVTTSCELKGIFKVEWTLDQLKKC